MKCPNCGGELKTYVFTKKLTKSGNSLVLTITEEVRKALDLKHGNIVQITLTKL